MRVTLTFFILIFVYSSASCQYSFPVNFNEYRLTNSQQQIGTNHNLVKRVLNQQFSNIITGQTKFSIGNFASVDPTDAAISFAGNIISNNGSVLTVNAKGGVSDGLLSVFKNSKLNNNISLDVQYNFLALGKKQLHTNVDSSDQYERTIDKIEYEYNVKRLSISSGKDSLTMNEKKEKTQKIFDSLNNALKQEVNPSKIPGLYYERSKIKLLLDSINAAVNRYDTLEELHILHNKVIQQLDKLSLQSAVEGFCFGWFSVAYKVNKNSFKLFYPSAAFTSQLADTSFVSHEARLQYSYYSSRPQNFGSFFFDAGIAFSYSDNYNSLKKIELSETTEFGPVPGARTQSKKFNAYQGRYSKNIAGLNGYADLIYFLFSNKTTAVHINPEWITQTKEKPLFNFYAGFLMAFKSAKTEGSIINAELYYKFLDVFKTSETDYQLFERNNIGIRFSFPIQFKYK